MEKFFQPKFFVGYCAIFLVLYLALQYVANARLKEEGERWGAYVFNWNWTGGNWSSRTRMVQANVISRGEHDAVIEVKGQQEVRVADATPPAVADCSAMLKLYKRGTARGDVWELGEVQFQ